MKTAVSIPDPLFEEAESAAKKRKVSRSKFYQEALLAYLDKARRRAVTEALNTSYTAEPDLPDPMISTLAVETMRRMEDEDEAGRSVVGRSRRTKRVRARLPAARGRRVGK